MLAASDASGTLIAASGTSIYGDGIGVESPLPSFESHMRLFRTNYIVTRGLSRS
jgi:hypothetical protein